MSGPDALFSARNNFYLGAYQEAINACDLHSLSDQESVERDSIIYRSYIALRSYQLVINEIRDSAPTALQAVKLLAMYLSGDKESALLSLKEWLSDSAISNNPTLKLVAGTIYMHEQDYHEALNHTHMGGTLELNALNIHIYLKMHRTDHAEKQLKIMQQVDEDHTLTQLANAWIDLAVQGGSKVQEAYLIFQDFCEKYQSTVSIINGMAISSMHMGRFDEAEASLLEGLKKDPQDADTLANLIVCNLHLGKQATRYLSQLKLYHPDHLLIKHASTAEENFDRAIQAVA